MIKLSCKAQLFGSLAADASMVYRVSTGAHPPSCRPHAAQLLLEDINPIDGYDLYLGFNLIEIPFDAPFVLLPEDMRYISDEDIIALGNGGSLIRSLYRRHANTNSFLMTERCNHLCIMCSQPPRDVDDGFLAIEVIEALPLINTDTVEIGLTGGEPTLTGEAFYKIVELAECHLPRTALHVLSNGRSFVDHSNAVRLADCNHHDLMIEFARDVRLAKVVHRLANGHPGSLRPLCPRVTSNTSV